MFQSNGRGSAVTILRSLWLALAIGLTGFGNAYALGSVSRNCNAPLYVQESMTKDYLGGWGGGRYWLYARSNHFIRDSATGVYSFVHFVDNPVGWQWGGPSNFWRAYAGHTTELLSGGVWGQHWYADPATQIVYAIADSIAENCNLASWGTEWGL